MLISKSILILSVGRSMIHFKTYVFKKRSECICYVGSSSEQNESGNSRHSVKC